MKPFIHDVTGIDIIHAFARVKHMPYSLLLDSADNTHANNRYSFAMCYPIETIEAQGGTITVTNWEQRLSFSGDPFNILQSRINAWVANAETIPDLPPFQGGAAGLFSYDLGRYLEDIPNTNEPLPDTPDMAVGIYDQVLAHDHATGQSYILTHARSEKEATKKRDTLLHHITENIDIPDYAGYDIRWSPDFEAAQYAAQIQKTIDYIHAGDTFQVNLAQRFQADTPDGFDPFLHYMHLRQFNPAPFASYMNLGNIKISSASPERFLSVNNGHIETCPIKGTRPRFDDPKHDENARNDLIRSVKDRAENTMIVDLLRNDLSKVCTHDSVTVSKLCQPESFASVHHLVSTVNGMLAEDKNAIDALRACFPGGSITGAPKIRSMEIIEELEPVRRGPYCGSIGYVGFDGAMDTNILIRTLIYNDKNITLHAGGGIVADSNAKAEYQETMDKALAMFRSFEPAKNKTNHTMRARRV